MGLLKQAIVIAIALSLLSLLILVGIGFPSDSGAEPKNESPYYISVIEAGSEDSKIYSFKFVENKYYESILKLDDTNFVKVKPGLFAIADTPSEIDAGVISLVAHVDAFVPSAKQAFSPLLLRAPSSLQDEAESSSADSDSDDHPDPSEKYPKGWVGGPTPLLLRAARAALLRSGYAVPGLESASVIDTQHRAAYSWYALNYVSGNFNLANETEAVIELEWDSLKITYEPNEKVLELLAPEDIYEIPFKGDVKKVFSKSYRNLGLLDLRFSLFELENDMNGTSFNSSCINPEIEEEPFTFQDIAFKVSGSKPGKTNKNGRQIVGIDECLALTDRIDFNQVSGEPLAPALPGFLAQSKVIVQAPRFSQEIEDELDFGKILSGERYLKGARMVCAENAAISINRPFACGDLLLLRLLLTKALGFDEKELVELKPMGPENNWALGFAHSQLTKHLLLSAAN